MLWTIRLSIILLVAGVFLSPQIIAYGIVVLVKRLVQIPLSVIRRLSANPSTT
jgi:hypothetical protein